NPAMPSRDKLSEFTAWCQKHITGDEKGEAQIFLDRHFQSLRAFCLWVRPECRSGGVELIPRSQQQDLIAGLEFFIRSRIDDVRAAAFDAHNARAGAGAEFEFA